MTRAVGITIRRDRQPEIGWFFYGQMDATHENPIFGRMGDRRWNSDEMRMRQRVSLHLKGAEGNNIRYSNIYQNNHFRLLVKSFGNPDRRPAESDCRP
jgi:hypothetical protein